MEYLGKIRIAVETTAQCNLSDAVIGGFQHFFCHLDPVGDQIIHRGLVNGGLETPQALSGADSVRIGDVFQRQLLGIIFLNESDHS